MRRLRHLLRRGRATALLEGAGALVVVAVLLLGPGGGPTGTARVELSRAAGTLSLANSREGSAILNATNMRPGARASGSVRVTNTGTLPSRLTLAPGDRRMEDAADRLLAARLQLVVVDVTDTGHPVTMYAGSLAGMPATSLGTLGAGSGRDYVFVASLSHSAADNALQGAALAAGFTWTASAASGATTAPKPKPASKGTPKPKPSTTPLPTVTPAPTTTPPSATAKCKARKVKIRIRRWHGHRVRRVTVEVGHKRAHRAKVRHGKVTVKVKGSKRVRIKVTVKYAGGHHKAIKRRARGRRC